MGEPPYHVNKLESYDTRNRKNAVLNVGNELARYQHL